MTTYLIISENISQREEYAMVFCKNKQIHQLDTSIFDLEEKKQSLGIEDVKRIQQKLLLKPFQGTEKAIIMYNAHTLTFEAQNALLKTLEEPPENTYILLTARTIETFLPTILSRSSIVILEDTDEAIAITDEIFSMLIGGSLGDKLKLAQDYSKDKTQAIQFLQSMIKKMREHLLLSYNQQADQLLNQIYLLQETLITIKTTNVSIRLALENLFLNL